MGALGNDAYQPDDALDPAERAIVDLVRVGLRGDASSVRQLARRMLRRHAAQPFSTELRQQLGALMVGQGDPVLRGARPPMPVDSDGQLALARIDDDLVDEPPVLDPVSAVVIAALIDQRKQAARLALTGLEPPKTLLLQGPPGVGKTLTARHLARELSLPLMTIELAALMSSLLGQTGQNLPQSALLRTRLPLRAAARRVRRRRQAARRPIRHRRAQALAVSVLLLELERWPDTGLLIAAMITRSRWTPRSGAASARRSPFPARASQQRVTDPSARPRALCAARG